MMQFFNALESFLYSSIVLKIIAALSVFFLGLIAGHLASKFLRKLLSEFAVDKALTVLNIHFSVEKSLSIFIAYLFYIAGLLQALNILGIGTPLLNIFLILVLLAVLVSFLLFLKDFFPNIIAGFKLKKLGLKPGIVIVVEDIKGVLESINLLETKIVSNQEVLFVPNKKFLKGFKIVKRKR